VKHQNDPKDMHYHNEGNVNVNTVGYDICILSLGVLHHINENNAHVNWLDMILSMCP
jgi:hypothetical protein